MRILCALVAGWLGSCYVLTVIPQPVHLNMPQAAVCCHNPGDPMTEKTPATNAEIREQVRDTIEYYAPDPPTGCALPTPAEPCRCSNGYECPHRCWHCHADRAAGCEEWCHIRPFDTEEAAR